MTTLMTNFGIIQKIKVNEKTTFVLPQNLTGTKLQNLKKKYKDFFEGFKIIPLSKKEKTSNFFKMSFMPLTGITSAISEQQILFFAAFIFGFIFASLVVALYVEYRKSENQKEKISFNDINSNF
jgi:hypothetical protein